MAGVITLSRPGGGHRFARRRRRQGPPVQTADAEIAAGGVNARWDSGDGVRAGQLAASELQQLTLIAKVTDFLALGLSV